MHFRVERWGLESGQLGRTAAVPDISPINGVSAHFLVLSRFERESLPTADGARGAFIKDISSNFCAVDGLREQVPMDKRANGRPRISQLTPLPRTHPTWWF